MTKIDRAFVTLATSDPYAIGALVLAHSLRESGTAAQLVVMVTKEGISSSVLNLLRNVFDHIEVVDPLDSGDHAHLALLTRPDLGITFTKLHCWRLAQYEKAVFLDADTLVLKNVDNLFDYEELSAAADPGWPDCFNSGVFVFRPSEETYDRLLLFAMEHGSFDGADQGLLNQFFSDWPCSSTKRVPFTYNCMAQTFYSYTPAMVKFRSQIRVVHFIGTMKPWHCSVNSLNGQVTSKDIAASGHSLEHLQTWWNVFLKHVVPAMARTTEFLSSFSCHLPYGMYQLVTELIATIRSHQESPTDAPLSHRGPYEWYLSRQWFGEKQDTGALGFPFLLIHKPHFEPVEDVSFLQPRESCQDVMNIITDTSTRETAVGSSDVSEQLSPPIVRYFITIGDDEDCHMEIISHQEWQSIMKDEGLFEDGDLDEQEVNCGRLARLILPQVDPAVAAPTTASERERQYAWERNEIDYTGSDRFDTILNKITAAIHPPPK